MKKIIITTICLALFSNVCFAEDIYIAQTSTGANSGADCIDAHSASWFNSSGNWSSTKTSGKIGPGDTIHLCGSFTAAGGSTMLTAQSSGTSGLPITILFESNSKLSAPYWSVSSGAINISNKSYITIDGGSNGTIEATDNGTALSNKVSSRGIVASYTSNCTIKNLSINNMYVHDNVYNNNDTGIDQTNTNGIIFLNSPNLTIDHVIVKDAGWALNGWGNNITISNCDISNVDHGIAFGPGGTVSGINIYGNHFHNYVNWDTTSNVFHHDGIHMWGGITAGGAASDRVNGVNIYNNTFDGDSGVNITAHIFLEEQVQNVNIFNNIFIVPSNRTINAVWLEGRNQSSDSYNNGHGLSNAIYNNYINAGKISGGGAALFARYQDNLSVKNNIFVGGNGAISLVNTTIATGGINNNIYAIMGNGNTFGFGSNSSDNFSSWKSWLPSGSGQDSNSWAGTLTDIKIDSNGYIQSGSPAKGLGTNLSNIGISALNNDKNGSPRSASLAWDAGAYNFTGLITLPSPVLNP